MLMIPLSEFREGERGVIIRLNGSGTFRKRLQEMGFIRGSEVFVEKYAPLRDPIELVIKGYHVSLRVEEASQIMMEKLEQEQK
jgi:Fe2+ transport system protein FeoA